MGLRNVEINKLVVFCLLATLIPFSHSYATGDTLLADILDNTIYESPSVYWEPTKDQGNIKALFYSTIPYQGKETRAFAYLGIPKSDKPVPAIVLVHGGGGKAFHEWVKLWNDRGYAAIAMSLEGHMPDEKGRGKHQHSYSGPTRVGRFDDIERPLKEQWMYHAISTIVLGHSLIASLPEIDADRIGITGISWGGILSSLVSGVDKRLKCAMPVYGAGYLYESKGHFGNHGNKSPEFIEKKKFWDPARQFAQGEVPTLWVNGDSDGHFSINITSSSYKITSDHAYLNIHPGMPHGHRAGWDPEQVPEIYAFADHILKDKDSGLERITQQPTGRKSVLTYESKVRLSSATIYYLNEPITYRQTDGSKHPRPGSWLSKTADIHPDQTTVQVQLPKEAMTYYVNLEDERGFLISSVLVELD